MDAAFLKLAAVLILLCYLGIIFTGKPRRKHLYRGKHDSIFWDDLRRLEDERVAADRAQEDRWRLEQQQRDDEFQAAQRESEDEYRRSISVIDRNSFIP